MLNSYAGVVTVIMAVMLWLLSRSNRRNEHKMKLPPGLLMSESEEKNWLLKGFEGVGLLPLEEFDYSFTELYHKHRAELTANGYLKAYEKPSALVARMSTYIRLTKEGQRFLDKGGYQ